MCSGKFLLDWYYVVMSNDIDGSTTEIVKSIAFLSTQLLLHASVTLWLISINKWKVYEISRAVTAKNR